MKRNDAFILKEIAGKNVLVAFGEKAIDFNGIITLNGTGKFLWDNLENEIDIDTLAEKLSKQYGIDINTALADTQSFLDSLKEDGCIDE